MNMKTRMIVLCCLMCAACVPTFGGDRPYEYDNHEKQMTVDIEYYVIKALLEHYYPNISLQYWIHASFTITSTSLVLHYTNYTLGSWADGEQEVEIPLESLKPLLNPKWKHLIS